MKQIADEILSGFVPDAPQPAVGDLADFLQLDEPEEA
jgi:hypothetical protein